VADNRLARVVEGEKQDAPLFDLAGQNLSKRAHNLFTEGERSGCSSHPSHASRCTSTGDEQAILLLSAQSFDFLFPALIISVHLVGLVYLVYLLFYSKKPNNQIHETK
jgi:hypothetical protein